MPKKQLTIEEKMNNALVPEEEWPYKLPDNWCWVRGSMILRRMESQKPAGEYFQYIDIESVDNSRQEVIAPKLLPVSKAPSRASRKLHIGDTLFSLVRPYLMNIAYIDDSLAKCIASTGFYVCSPNKNMEPRYLYWLMVSPFTVDGLNNYMKGDNSPSIRGSDIENYAFPLPPLPEQQRIVSRIESLFVKLDEAKEKVQNVIDGADTRKAAILHQAFTGKLTAKWRKENGVSDDSWEEVTIKSLCNSLKYGTAKKSAKEGKVPVLRMGNLQNGEIDWTSLVYSNDSDDIRKYSLQNEDVLFNRTNSAELVGKTSIYRGQQPAIYAGYLIKLDYKRDRILGDYLNYVLNSPSAKEYCNAVKTDGVNQSNINAQKIGAFGVRLPKLSEQKEIVRRLDNLLNKEKSICKSCEVSLAAIEAMKKAILAKAFRGELGTNNPVEESSKELLREIISI